MLRYDNHLFCQQQCCSSEPRLLLKLHGLPCRPSFFVSQSMSTSSHIGDCAPSNLNDHPVTAFALQVNTSWAEATRIDSAV